MGLFNRGQSISGMWLDGKPAIRAYLGDVLVWDGTSPAFVNVPRALVSALAVSPAIRADASITAVRTLGSSAAYAPSLTAFATVDPETAVIVTAQAGTPAVRADSLILVDVITVAAQALPAVAAQSSSAAVEVPSISVSVSSPTPTVAAHFTTTIPAITVNASAQVPVITATGAAVVNVPVSAVNATARVPVVSGNSSVVAFAVTADATAKTPVVTASSNASPPKAAATGLARVPVVQANNFITVSMTKNGDQQLAASTWAEVGPWTAGSNSTVTGNALRVNGSGNATIQVGSEWPTSTSVKDWRVLKNGTVVWTKGSGTGLTLADTFALAVVDGDLLTCEAWNSSGVTANRIVKTGANTYLRVVPT
jgi:hypothetical protein